MLTERRLRYLWFTLTGGLVLISVFPGSSWMCHIVGSNDQNRWMHFLSLEPSLPSPSSFGGAEPIYGCPSC